MAVLTETQIEDALAKLEKWQREGNAIVRQYQFKDFPAAIHFVDQVAVAAESAWHHPDIDIRWNKVRLLLTTHDQGGLTEKDTQLATTFDEMAADLAADER